MLIGRTPFRGSSAEVMYQHQHAPLPVEQLTGIPQPVVVLLEVLLAKDPVRRFQTPAELLKVMPTVTRFHLQKLDHPVINDANRKINSGDWKVIVSGQGDEYNSIMRDLGEPSFGDTCGKTEYYGEIDLEATNK